MTTLSTIKEWEQVKQLSFQKPQVIYIHSLSCPISTVTIRRMANSGLSEDAYIVPVQTSQAVSDAIAEDLKVQHESPQIIMMKDGKAIYDADHWAVEPDPVIALLTS